MVEVSTPISFEEEYRQFYTHTFEADNQNQAKLDALSDAFLDPNEVAAAKDDFLLQQRVIGHARFSIWLDLKGKSERGYYGR